MPCDHFCCNGCLGDMARVHVKERNVFALRCPLCDPKAEEVGIIGPELLIELGIPKEEVEKLEELRLARCLDGMKDVAYCPRCEKDTGDIVACIEDEEDHMARCEVCGFVFCGICRQVFHPGVECLSPEEQLEALRRRQAGARSTGEEMRALEERLLNEAMNLKYLQEKSRQCPKCKVGIERSEGCNKMHCTQCDVYFCWKCGVEIKGYDHFALEQCKLFDEEEIRRWNRQMRAVQGNQAAVAAQRAHEARWLAGFIDPKEQRDRLRQCPTCKTGLVKHDKNNHMRCHNCNTHFCAACGYACENQRRPNDHFSKAAGGTCLQHSQD